MQSTSKRPSKYFISKGIEQFLTSVYEIASFIKQFFREAFRRPFESQEIIRQCYQVGYKSFSLITLTAFITGIVFTKQSRPSLASFGATSWLPSLIGIAIIKALAPLITGLICAGKIGSQMGAELGSMKVTEQIDAMEVSAVNPFKFLVVTRVIASTLMIPVLVLYSGLIGLFGAYLNIHVNEQTSFAAFIHGAFSRIGFSDLISSMARALIFGFTIGIIGCYKGYSTSQGTEGVGRAANASVVIIMFLLFVEEIVIVQFINWLQPGA